MGSEIRAERIQRQKTDQQPQDARSKASINSVERWVDVNASDHTGQTALHWSAVQGAVQVAEILLQEGASVGAADMYGYQLMCLADLELDFINLYDLATRINKQEVLLANFRHGAIKLKVFTGELISIWINEMDELLEGAVEDSFVGSLGPERSLFANEPPLGYLD
ncbi:hypothetical protein ACET3Z_010431 [Daucus carota]